MKIKCRKNLDGLDQQDSVFFGDDAPMWRVSPSPAKIMSPARTAIASPLIVATPSPDIMKNTSSISDRLYPPSVVDGGSAYCRQRWETDSS